MPSTYAHYRFGKDVLSLLSKEYKQLVQEHRGLFDIGLHGPDLLFYYHPLHANAVSNVGFAMHDRPGEEFFAQAGKTLSQNGYLEEMTAYIYGFICHFALDRECHGYIDEKIASSGVSHAEIEAEFDRSLLVKDGYDPVGKKLTEHIQPVVHNARIISRFFPAVTEKQICKSLRSIVFYNNLLCAPGKQKRRLIYGLLKLSGNYEVMKGLVIGYQPNPLCEDSCIKLTELYQSAKEKAVKLIEGFLNSAEGKQPFDPLYHYTFGSRLMESANEENTV